jgi:DNA-binding MurR/RpiR family transcriptional regulator
MARLETLIPGLSAAERRVAAQILRIGDRASELTVREMANQAGVSVASVSRLAKKIGCTDFRELKLELARGRAVPAIAVYQNIAARDTDADIVDKILGGSVRSLEDTVKILNLPDLSLTAKAIARCDQLLFLGGGSSGYIAQDSALRFAHLGIRAEAHLEPIGTVVHTLNLDKTAVVFGISHSGRSAMTVKGLELAEEQGALTIGLSNYARSPLQAVCRYFFCTSFRENRVRAVAISSRISQIFVLDALYALTARHLSRLPDEKRVSGIIDDNYRLPERRTERRAPQQRTSQHRGPPSPAKKGK